MIKRDSAEIGLGDGRATAGVSGGHGVSVRGCDTPCPALTPAISHPLTETAGVRAGRGVSVRGCDTIGVRAGRGVSISDGV